MRSQQGSDSGANRNLTFDPNMSGQTHTENSPLVLKKNTGELTFKHLFTCHNQAAATQHQTEPLTQLHSTGHFKLR